MPGDPHPSRYLQSGSALLVNDEENALMEAIRVLVADDEEGVRDVLGAVIASDPTLTLVGSAAEADSAIAMATEEQPDVALVDVRMPGGGGLRAAKEISRRSASTKIIAVSAHEDSDTVLSMLLAGASGYVAKSDPTDEILRTIHRTLEERPAPGANEIERVLNTFDECREHLQGRTSITDLQHRRIERALHRGSMSARLRPIGDLRTGDIAGADATAEFRTGPDRSTDAWFAEARAVGKHVPLELSLVREALSEIDRVPEGGFMAVNVSPDTICSPKLRHTLEGVPPERVVLAISEQEPIHDDQAFDEDLFELRDGGIRVAIDDAGTGIASLRHLRRIAPDFVRIDETITSRMQERQTRVALAATVTSFCAAVGAEVIAKKVGTRSEAEVLAELGIRLAQGDFLRDVEL